MRDWIVMTSSASMPRSVKSPYRNVAVVEIEEAGIIPARISVRAKGVRRIVHKYGPQSVGTTARCAYQRTLAKAEEMCVAKRANHAAALEQVMLCLETGKMLTPAQIAALD